MLVFMLCKALQELQERIGLRLALPYVQVRSSFDGPTPIQSMGLNLTGVL